MKGRYVFKSFAVLLAFSGFVPSFVQAMEGSITIGGVKQTPALQQLKQKLMNIAIQKTGSASAKDDQSGYSINGVLVIKNPGQTLTEAGRKLEAGDIEGFKRTGQSDAQGGQATSAPAPKASAPTARPEKQPTAASNPNITVKNLGGEPAIVVRDGESVTVGSVTQNVTTTTPAAPAKALTPAGVLDQALGTTSKNKNKDNIVELIKDKFGLKDINDLTGQHLNELKKVNDADLTKMGFREGDINRLKKSN